jgi:hypothetical protein
VNRFWLLVALAGCRIGFTERTTSDASPDVASDGRVPLAPRFVQTDSTANAGSTTAGLPLPSSVVAGNLILVAIDYVPGAGITLVGVSDDKGNPYTPLGPFDGNNGVRHYLAWSIAQAAGPTTVTSVLTSAPGTYYDLRLHEYTDTAQTNPIESTDVAAGTTIAVDGAHSPVITTREPNELIFGFFTLAGGTGSAGTGFAERSTFDSDLTEDKLAPTPGAYEAVATCTGTSWTAIVASIRGR